MLLCSVFLQLFLIFLDLLPRREEMWISPLLFRCRGEAFWSELPTLTFCSLEATLRGLEMWGEVDVLPAAPVRSFPSCPPACSHSRKEVLLLLRGLQQHWLSIPLSSLQIFSLLKHCRSIFYFLSQISRVSEQRICQ